MYISSFHCSRVQTSGKTPTDIPEKIFMVFTFAPSSLKKPHPQRRCTCTAAWELLPHSDYRHNQKVAVTAVDTMIRGYHVYRDLRSAVVDEQVTRTFQHCQSICHRCCEERCNCRPCSQCANAAWTPHPYVTSSSRPLKTFMVFIFTVVGLSVKSLHHAKSASIRYRTWFPVPGSPNFQHSTLKSWVKPWRWG